MIRSSALALAPAILLATSTALKAQSKSPRAPVEITGEFRDNGSCQVFANGVAVFHAADSAETTYIRGATLNVAPDGFDAHEIWCAPRSSEQPEPPTVATDRVFVIMLYAPTGKLAEPRTYQIKLGLPSPESAPYRAGAALFGVSPQMLNDTIPVHTGVLYLAGSHGAVVITRVDADRIVGTFRIATRDALTL
jgi:hypothetical protein